MRFVLTSAVNTVPGLTVFPALKTVFPNESLFLLMAVSYTTCVLFSYTTHGRFTFKAPFAISSLAKFFLLHFCLLGLNYLFTLALFQMIKLDVRLIQPLVALLIQLGAFWLYRHIYKGSEDDKS